MNIFPNIEEDLKQMAVDSSFYAFYVIEWNFSAPVEKLIKKLLCCCVGHKIIRPKIGRGYCSRCIKDFH